MNEWSHEIYGTWCALGKSTLSEGMFEFTPVFGAVCLAAASQRRGIIVVTLKLPASGTREWSELGAARRDAVGVAG